MVFSAEERLKKQEKRIEKQLKIQGEKAKLIGQTRVREQKLRQSVAEKQRSLEKIKNFNVPKQQLITKQKVKSFGKTLGSTLGGAIKQGFINASENIRRRR